jgi:hypothetical protein
MHRLSFSVGGVAVLVLLCACTPASVVSGQVLNPTARDLLASQRTLLPAEIPVILTAVRAAVAGKTLRLVYVPERPEGPEILMRADGQRRFTRTVSGYDIGRSGPAARNPDGSAPAVTQHVDLITFTDYTGRPAKTCNGTPIDGELILQYEHRSTDNRWTVQARTRRAVEELSPPFDMLAGMMTLELGERRQVNGRPARALVAPFHPAGQPLSDQPPPVMTQSLWIDTVSLLPLRWSIYVPAAPAQGIPAIPDYGLFFIYDPSIDLRPPDGLSPPDCIR